MSAGEIKIKSATLGIIIVVWVLFGMQSLSGFALHVGDFQCDHGEFFVLSGLLFDSGQMRLDSDLTLISGQKT